MRMELWLTMSAQMSGRHLMQLAVILVTCCPIVWQVGWKEVSLCLGLMKQRRL